MKKNVLLYMAAVAGLVLAGCNKTGAPEVGGSLNMTVKASIGDLTKVEYDGNKTSFEKEDTLSLYAWIGAADKVSSSLVINGVVNKFDGESWIPKSQMLWKNVHDAHYFIAVSPAHEVVDFEADPFVLNPAEYAANDLLIANELTGLKVTTDQKPNPVSLNFSHALAKLNVNLKFRSQWDATPEVTSVATTAMDCYKVNYLTKEVTAYGDVAQVPLQALTTTPQTYALSYSGLQVPQDAVTVITVVIDGKDYIYTAAEPIVLQSGKITTLGLIVGREKITLGSVSVANWDEGTTYEEDGDAVIPDSIVLNLTTPKVGEVIGSDGKNYDYASLPDGVTAIAVINYVSGENGLALALTDEGAMNWFAASSTCAAHTPAFSNFTWRLPSNTDWEKMINGAGGYDALRTAFNSVGGTNLQKATYWSASQNSLTHAYGYDFLYNIQSSNNSKYTTSFYARACLAF
jgi:hypothetical protein